MDKPRPRVPLRDIVEAIDVPNEEWSVFLNRETGRLVTLTGDDDEEDEEAIDEDDDVWLRLPDKFEIDEYDMIMRFCREIEDDGVREEIVRASQGSGAFRRFQGLVRQRGLIDDWHAWRDAGLAQIAKEWMEDNEIDYDV
ncbi:hypothetical protein FJ250_11950 [bacterium]|nr:hypothetical protein [bacterium]